MRLLTDTHILVWFAEGSPRLPLFARELIADARNELFFSLESIREIAIKSGLGKKDFDVTAQEVYRGLVQNGSTELPITAGHVFALAELPLLHRDPFDRMLVAQAQVEKLTLLSVDGVLELYSFPVLGL